MSWAGELISALQPDEILHKLTSMCCPCRLPAITQRPLQSLSLFEESNYEAKYIPYLWVTRRAVVLAAKASSPSMKVNPGTL